MPPVIDRRYSGGAFKEKLDGDWKGLQRSLLDR